MSQAYSINGTSEEVDQLRQGATEFKSPWYSFDGEEWAKAYLVKPSLASPTFIEHQYNDVCCDHFCARGLLLAMADPIGAELDELMRDMAPDKDRLNHLLADYGMECEEVIGQGLIRLVGGDFIMTEGND